MSDLAIEAQGLTKMFGKAEAVAGIELSVPVGSLLGVLGPNGAGKTTAVRILTTIIRPDSGSARILGYDVVRDAAAVRYRIGLAGQYAAVDGNLTGSENLRLIGRLTQIPKDHIHARADELLKRFDLKEAGDRVVCPSSGGIGRRPNPPAPLVPPPPRPVP